MLRGGGARALSCSRDRARARCSASRGDRRTPARRGGDERGLQRALRRGRTRALPPLDVRPGVACVGGDAAPRAGSQRRAPSSFPPRWRRTRPRTSETPRGAGAHFLRPPRSWRVSTPRTLTRPWTTEIKASRPRPRRVSRHPLRRRRATSDADFGVSCVFGSGALTRPGFRAVWVTRGTNDDGHGHGTESLLPSASFGPFELLISAPPRVFAAYPAETTAFGGGVLRAGSQLSRRSRRFGDRLRRVGQSLAGSGSRNVVRTSTLVDVVGSALARVETPDFFAAGVDAVTGDDGRARVAAGFGFSGFSVSGSRVRRRSETSRRAAGPELGSPPRAHDQLAYGADTNDERQRRRGGDSRLPPPTDPRTAPTASPARTIAALDALAVGARGSSDAGDALRSAVGNRRARASSGPWDPSRPSAARPAHRNVGGAGAVPAARSAGRAPGGRGRATTTVRGARRAPRRPSRSDAAKLGRRRDGGGGGRRRRITAEGALLGGSGGSGAMVCALGPRRARGGRSSARIRVSTHARQSGPGSVARAPRAVGDVRFRFRNRRERQKRRGTIEYPNTRASDFRFRVLRR